SSDVVTLSVPRDWMVLRSDSPLEAAGALVLLVHAASAAAPTASAAPPSSVRRLNGEARVSSLRFSLDSSTSSGMCVPPNLVCGLSGSLHESKAPLSGGVKPVAAGRAPLHKT